MEPKAVQEWLEQLEKFTTILGSLALVTTNFAGVWLMVRRMSRAGEEARAKIEQSHTEEREAILRLIDGYTDRLPNAQEILAELRSVTSVLSSNANGLATARRTTPATENPVERLPSSPPPLPEDS